VQNTPDAGVVMPAHEHIVVAGKNPPCAHYTQFKKYLGNVLKKAFRKATELTVDY